MSHYCAKRYLGLNYDQVDIDKISDFHKTASNLIYSEKVNHLTTHGYRHTISICPIDFVAGRDILVFKKAHFQF